MIRLTSQRRSPTGIHGYSSLQKSRRFVPRARYETPRTASVVRSALRMYASIRTRMMPITIAPALTTENNRSRGKPRRSNGPRRRNCYTRSKGPSTNSGSRRSRSRGHTPGSTPTRPCLWRRRCSSRLRLDTMTNMDGQPGTMAPTLRITRLCGVWWIIGMGGPALATAPDYPSVVDSEMGPYPNKKEAETDLRGLKRFFEYEHTAV